MQNSAFAEALARLPGYLGSHILVSLTALALGLGVSLPLAMVTVRRPVLRTVLLAVASVLQTIPGLALLALFYPLLLGVSALTERAFGLHFSALGFLPSVLALALYSMLPVLRNTVTGLAAIQPSLREAARGLGATPARVLRDIDVPLAMPVIMAGIRTASVWVIGTATLSTPIGQTSLGNYIFTGLQTQNWIFVMFGCVAVALLALAVDQLLSLVELGLARRKRRNIALGAAGIAILIAAGLAPSFVRPPAAYVIGAKTFTEQYVLAALLQQRLAAAGLSSRIDAGLGSNVLFDALASGEVDIAVDYSGTLWVNRMHRTDVPPREALLDELGRWLTQTNGIRLLGPLGFENAYALAMPRAKAEALNVRNIADLARVAPQLTIASDYEFFARPEWRALREAYRLQFKAERTMQPDFMYRAAASGEVDVISAYTSDGQIAQFDMTVLEDPKHVVPPYDAILLVSPRRAKEEGLIAALTPLVNAIPVATMREANAKVSSGATAAETAAWVQTQVRRK